MAFAKDGQLGLDINRAAQNVRGRLAARTQGFVRRPDTLEPVWIAVRRVLRQGGKVGAFDGC
jgi:hypothetical protein